MLVLEGRQDFQKVEDEIAQTIPINAHPVEARYTQRNTIEAIQDYTITPAQQPTPPQHFTEENRENIESASKLIVASDGSHDPVTGKAA